MQFLYVSIKLSMAVNADVLQNRPTSEPGQTELTTATSKANNLHTHLPNHSPQCPDTPDYGYVQYDGTTSILRPILHTGPTPPIRQI